jgi:hypothetical protein
MRSYPTLHTQIDAIIAASEKRMIALMRQSLQDVINDAQKPVAKGGRMRVDTGFLRASGQPSLNGIPSGPVRGERNESYSFDTNSLTLTLAKLEIGQTFFFGWTAAYARYREAYDGFLEIALQKWSTIVERNTEEIRQRIKS